MHLHELKCHCGNARQGSDFDQGQCWKCWLQLNNSDYQKFLEEGPPKIEPIKFDPAAAPRPQAPTKAELLNRFLEAIATELKWRSTGGRGPTVEEKTARRAHCDLCPHRDPAEDRCTICGCYLESKLLHLPPVPLGKLDCASQRCPLGLWDSVGGYKAQGCGG